MVQPTQGIKIELVAPVEVVRDAGASITTLEVPVVVCEQDVLACPGTDGAQVHMPA